jgi:hypothetical protein
MPTVSNPIAMASAYATDDEGRYTRLLEITRECSVSLEEMDERDDDGRVQVRVFASTKEELAHAIKEIEKEHP